MLTWKVGIAQGMISDGQVGMLGEAFLLLKRCRSAALGGDLGTERCSKIFMRSCGRRRVGADDQNVGMNDDQTECEALL